MHGCIHRTNRLAWGRLAMLTRHRLVHDLRIAFVAHEIAVEPNPVHDPPALHLALADNGDVVLRLARDHASRAAGAGSEVDDHAPLVRSIKLGLRSQIERDALRWRTRPVRAGVLGIAKAHRLTAFHAAFVLGAGEGEPAAGFFDLHIIDEIRVEIGAEFIDVEAMASADPAGLSTAIAKRD